MHGRQVALGGHLVRPGALARVAVEGLDDEAHPLARGTIGEVGQRPLAALGAVAALHERRVVALPPHAVAGLRGDVDAVAPHDGR